MAAGCLCHPAWEVNDNELGPDQMRKAYAANEVMPAAASAAHRYSIN